MFQKYIKIKNFRAVKDIKINFSKGINLINGANASGKSSIIMALVFMKFNWMKYNLDKCINDTTKLGYFEIEEEFEKNNTRFYQKYIYKNGKGTRELTINNKEFFKNTDAVNKLKEFFDPDLLRPSMIYMQKEAGAIEISSSARREFFKKIFNLIFKEQLLILETETKEYENQYDTLDKEAYLLDNYNYDYKTLKNIELSKEDILILEKEITFFKNEINKLNNEKIDLTEKNKEIEKLTSTINTKKTLIFDLDKKIKTYENEISKWEGELYQDFEKEIKSNETLLECLNDNVIKELEYKLSNIKLLRIGIFDETKLNETVNSYYDIQSSLNELRKSFKLLKSGKCPTCKKEFVTNDIKSWEELIKSKEVILNEILVLKEKLEAEKEKNINDKKELDADINKKSLLSKDIELEKSKLEANKKSLLNKLRFFLRQLLFH